MPLFRATHKSNLTVHEYDASAPDESHLNDEWRLEQLITVLPPDDEEVTPEPPEVIWDKLGFLRRFTDAERKEVWAVQPLNADLDDGIRLLMAATEVHNTDPDVIRIVYMLEAGGVIAEGRAEEILYGG
jgi:hypothetical protein